MTQLINELKDSTSDLVRGMFNGTTSNVDMSNLILSGHSFGGQTAILTASQLPEEDKPRAVLTLDPSLYAFCDEI